MVGEALLHVPRERGIALSKSLHVHAPDGELGLTGGIGDASLAGRLNPGAGASLKAMDISPPHCEDSKPHHAVKTAVIESTMRTTVSRR
jgi:hypothetical protein